MDNYKKCPNCGHVLSTDQEFCPNCDVFEPLQSEGYVDKISEELEKQEQHVLEQSEVKEDVSVQSVEVFPEEDLVEEVIIGETVVKEVAESEPVGEEKEVEVLEPKLPQTESVSRIEPQIEKFSKGINKEETGLPANEVLKTEEPLEQALEQKPVDSQKKEPSKSGKRNRVIALILFAAIVVVGGYFGFTKYQAKKEEDRVSAVKKQVEKATINADRLYLNEEKVFLSESYTAKGLADLKKEVASITDKKYKKDLEAKVTDIDERAKKVETVNGLFENPIINGSKLTSEPIKADLTEAPVELKEEKDAFDGLVNSGIKEAKAQIETTKNAKEAIGKIFDTDVKKDATRKLYDDAKTQIDKLKNETLKKDYVEKLAKVETYVVSEEKKASELLEQQKREVALAQQQAVDAANAAAVNDNSATGPWAWNPGIKEQVIGECLRRGYMVEGGYELRKKEVINGEGFYDLYATNNKSKLLKDRSESELPIYLVTINVKTGWFKGEGPN